MICPECGAECKDGSKFCRKCGKQFSSESTTPINQSPVKTKKNNNVLIISVAAIICVAIIAGAFVLMNNNSSDVNNAPVMNNSNDINESISSDVDIENQTKKSWKLIDTYVGDGSGSKAISIPAGDIKIKISAYPIKNYDTNHVYLMGPGGELARVSWDSNSPVETRSDSYKYSSNSPEDFNIVYYETESWEVEVYQYS